MSDQQPWDDQPPWDAFGQQDPRQGRGQPQYPPHQPYGQQDPNQYQPQHSPPPQQPYGQQPSPQGRIAPLQQPGYVPPSGRGAKDPWSVRYKVLAGFLAVAALFFAGALGAVLGGRTGTSAAPAPTVTMIQHDPGATVTVTAGPTVTATVSVTPTANAQGEATQISDDGVYVIGQDIPGGTWHTSGGGQCYEATLSGTDTINDIISNNNFTGPDTVDLAGAYAFDINGGCTWQQEG
jgi:hypothetical protein